MADRLQPGIYFRPGERPGGFFGIMFLRVTSGLPAAEVDASLSELWQIWQGLRAGAVPDLPGETLPSGDLSVLLGWGPKAFDIPGSRRTLPRSFGPEARFRSALAAGGGPVLRGSGLTYDASVRRNPATEEFCVQLIADTHLAVDRAIVETWKWVHDHVDPETGAAPIEPATFYLGAARDDHRSWIDFHDGISNLRADQRLAAIAVKPLPTGDPDAWTAGGTFLAFMRLRVDLARWRTLDRRAQELVVGRDKLSGCPLTGVDGAGAPVPLAGCPINRAPIADAANDPIAETPAVADPVLRASHVQRANHHQGPVDDPSSRRIFRQGYEFMEWSAGSPGFSAGLNFVSFQDHTSRLLGMLTLDTWLGSTNFGGPPGQPGGDLPLLTTFAAGMYLVPPLADERYPGAGVLVGE